MCFVVSFARFGGYRGSTSVSTPRAPGWVTCFAIAARPRNIHLDRALGGCQHERKINGRASRGPVSIFLTNRRESLHHPTSQTARLPREIRAKFFAPRTGDYLADFIRTERDFKSSGQEKDRRCNTNLYWDAPRGRSLEDLDTQFDGMLQGRFESTDPNARQDVLRRRGGASSKGSGVARIVSTAISPDGTFDIESPPAIRDSRFFPAPKAI